MAGRGPEGPDVLRGGHGGRAGADGDVGRRAEGEGGGGAVLQDGDGTPRCQDGELRRTTIKLKKHSNLLQYNFCLNHLELLRISSLLVTTDNNAISDATKAVFTKPLL